MTKTAQYALGFVLYVAVVAALLPQALHWDGLGYLQASRNLGELDPQHPLYPASIRVAHSVVGLFGGSVELAARLLSVLAGGFVLVFTWRGAERSGLASWQALAVGLLFASSALCVRQAGMVEANLLMLACILGANEAARRYEENGGSAWIGALVVLLIAAGWQVVALLAAPWVFREPLGRRLAGRSRTLALAAFSIVLVVGGLASDVRTRTFLSSPGQLFALFGDNLSFLATTLGEGAAFASVSTLLALLWLSVRGPQALLRPLLFAAPYLIVFTIRGRPAVALLFGILFGLGQAVPIALARVSQRATWRQLTGAALVLLVSVQTARTGLGTFRAAATPDENKSAAYAIEAALPPDSWLIAGPIAQHLNWFTDVPVCELRYALHGSARAAEGRANIDPVQVVLERARDNEDYDEVYITSEGLEYMRRYWDADTTPLEPQGHVRVKVTDELDLIRIVP